MLLITPGSAGIPLPGKELAAVQPDGRPCTPGEKGLVIRRPFPGLTPALSNEPERYRADYRDLIEGCYFTGDAAHLDEDGYVWLAGRADEVVKVAAYHSSVVEVEAALLAHPAIAEAGVMGQPDDIRGKHVSCFVVLERGYSPSPELRQTLLDDLRRELGPVAVIGELTFVPALPKTLRGTLMRRVLKAAMLGRDPTEITILGDARRAWLARLADIGRAAARP